MMSRRIFRINSSLTKNKGFSYIEAAVVITVLSSAILATLGYSKRAVNTDAQKAAVTQLQLQEIQKAIENFRILKKRLPCPADPLMSSDNSRANGTNYDNPTSATNATTCSAHNATGHGYDCYINGFGMEDLYNTSTVDGTTGAITNFKAGLNCPMPIGAVPVFALGLDESYMNDAWGRRIKYHVSPNLCGNNSRLNNATAADSAFTAKIGCTDKDYHDKTGNLYVISTSNPVLTKEAAFVLVSHGPNGYGAFLPSGIQLPINPDTTEAFNSGEAYNSGNTANSGIEATPYYKGPKSAIFDDIVLFETKAQIESMTNRTNTKNISVADCEANSTAIKNITMAESISMKNYNTQIQKDGSNVMQNTGDQALLSVLWATQNVCIAYYGTSAATINGQTWGGAQCPGNNKTWTGSTYDVATNSCECPGGLWDGNCTKFNPADIAGLRLWLDANDMSTIYKASCTTNVVTNNESVTCWRDKSGNGFNATAGTAPVYRENGLSAGKPSIGFTSASSQYLAIANGVVANGNNAYSVFLVSSATIMDNGGILSLANEWVDNQSLIFRYNLSGNFQTVWYNNDMSSNGGSMAINTPYLISCTYNTTNGRYCYKNSVPMLSLGNVNLNAVNSGLSNVGRAMGNYLNGNISEVLVYNNDILPANRQSLEGYLIGKWGIQ